MFLGISSGTASLLIGRLCDVKWINIRYVNRLGLAVAGIATLVLPHTRSYVSVARYAVVFGFSDGAFITTQNVILLNIVGPKRRAAAFGFGCMLCSLALAGGPPLAGESSVILHFTVVCFVAKPLNSSDARVDFVVIQTLLLFICKSLCYHAN